jgi:hypothetical protein
VDRSTNIEIVDPAAGTLKKESGAVGQGSRRVLRKRGGDVPEPSRIPLKSRILRKNSTHNPLGSKGVQRTDLQRIAKNLVTRNSLLRLLQILKDSLAHYWNGVYHPTPVFTFSA